MAVNQQKFQAGLVYLLAVALQRRCRGHTAVRDAVQWLSENGYSRESQRLLEMQSTSELYGSHKKEHLNG